MISSEKEILKLLKDIKEGLTGTKEGLTGIKEDTQAITKSEIRNGIKINIIRKQIKTLENM
ncbi:MAG: hypothetical protein J6J52_02190 [Oscillospiraceae bacterium]|nr:hypothetical protein [Oscillospiraceae bacterium]